MITSKSYTNGLDIERTTDMKVIKGTYIHKTKSIIESIMQEAIRQGYKVSYLHSLEHKFYKVVVY